MDVPLSVVEYVNRYHDTYRHPSLPRPDVSGLYDLFPSESAARGDHLHWPATWPYADRPGVYLIYDESLRLLYIGKAALLGQRLGAYFQYVDRADRSCRVVHGDAWSRPPRFVVTVALSEIFEAPSFEEFLIGKLNPSDNKTWAAKTVIAT